MVGDELKEALTDWLSRAGFTGPGGRRGLWRGVPREADAVHTTRAFPVFIETLRSIAGPVVLDLGPAVGPNVDFLGTRLSCKVLIEDLYGDLDRHVREGRSADVHEWLTTRLSNADASVDGVLCWDLCDYLDAEAVRVLAREMARVLKPGGVALTMFGTERLASAVYTRYVVVDAEHLQHRWYAAARPPGEVWLMGHLMRLFKGLEPVGSHLLVHQQREVLFRKPV
ncbi:MAG: class I SAM-dependent methyltransferase [Acidobacteriota bacterium]